jgi:hypothetical protein
MVGVIIVAVAIAGLATVTANVSGTISVAARNAERLVFLRSYANTLGESPSAVSATTATISVPVGASSVPITSWETNAAGSVVIHAAAPQWTGGAAADCSQVATTPNAQCLVAEVFTTPHGPGIKTTPLTSSLANPGVASPTPTAVTPGLVGTFTPAAGLTQLRFVVRISAASGAGALQFTDTGTGTVSGTASFTASTDGYLYGSIPVAGTTSAIRVDLTGASASLSHLYVYEAPR